MEMVVAPVVPSLCSSQAHPKVQGIHDSISNPITAILRQAISDEAYPLHSTIPSRAE